MTMGQSSRPNNWGRWGPDDEKGAPNLLVDRVIRAAASLIKRGIVYPLGLTLDRDRLPVSPSRVPIVHLMSLDGGDFAAGVKLPHDARAADDYIIMPTHSGTHIDALAHVWTGDELYNGHSANYVRSYGATRCGIDKMGPLVGRGVLLDVAAAKGVSVLDSGYEISAQDLDDCAQSQGVRVGEGDIVLIRTGWLTARVGNLELFHSNQPGIGLEAAHWLAARDVVAVGADNSSVEAMSWNGRRTTPNVVHQTLIREFGVPLIELMALDGPAQDGVHEFLLIVAPLPIKGGVGSPVNPVAIA